MARLRTHPPAEGDNLALILVDYDNLARILGPGPRQGHEMILGLVQELRRYLSDELRIRPVRVVTYGDFGGHGEDASDVMTAMSAAGVETRFVPAGLQSSDACLSLTVHATELLHARPDLSAFVLLSGDNWYVPLIQHLQRFGKFVLVASLDLPSSMGGVFADVSDAFLNARYLLGSQDRDTLSRRRQVSEATGKVEGNAEAQKRAPSDTSRVEDGGAYRALELLEENFGQYEEVYLTPLLRKMSETLDSEDGEPKDLVNLLQEAGVVWLEKRRGFPYDYTVLLVNDEHPDVVDVRGAVNDDSDYDDYDSGYDEDVDEEDHEYEDSRA